MSVPIESLSDADLETAIAALNSSQPSLQARERALAAVNEKSRRAPIRAHEEADQQRHAAERSRAASAYRAAGLDPEADRAGFERFLADQQRTEAGARLQRERRAAELLAQRNF
jgi:hypothetical protein